MKQRKGEERIVYQSLAMIMQFGLNMIVPIGMMSALGIWLDGKLGTSFLTIILFILGAVAGGQNIYRMVKRMCVSQDEETEKAGQSSSVNTSVMNDQDYRNEKSN